MKKLVQLKVGDVVRFADRYYVAFENIHEMVVVEPDDTGYVEVMYQNGRGDIKNTFILREFLRKVKV